MKNSKRMIAIIAASGLALGSMPGVANAQGSDILDLNLGTDLLGGSIDLGVDLFVGSAGGADSPLSGSLEGIEGGASSELPTDSLEAGSAEGSSELPTDSLEAGSAEGSMEPGSLASILASITAGSESGSMEPGSLEAASSETGSDSDSLDTDSLDPASLGTGSDSDSLDGGSLEGILAAIMAGSSDLGSTFSGDLGSTFSGDLGSTFSGDLGSTFEGSETIITGSANGGSSAPATLLAVGSLAAAGIGIGLAVSGGVNLPPLPQVNVGLVCNLPQEAIDFLKDNGSMERQECEPVQ